MTISAVLSDCGTIKDVAAWSRAYIIWLRQFLVLKNGVPWEDTFLRVFRLLDLKQCECCFLQWGSNLISNLSGTIAIDGKTVRGSGSGGETAIHMVSAFATRLGLVLGQEKVSANSNEIMAIPVLLDALYLQDFLVSTDAMGCQRVIADKIIFSGADYLLAVKGNQPNLHQAIQDAFIDCKDQIVHVEQVEQGHGRLIAQRCSVLPSTGIVSESDCRSCVLIARIDSVRQVKGQPYSMEQRYYITSRNLALAEFAEAVRSHWGIENQLHWVLDVNMKEDASTIRKDNAPESLLRMDTMDIAKSSLRLKRKRAAWDDDLRMRYLGLSPL